ncbi:MAG: DUF6175 family protein [Bacteroidales bacterium]|nr:DUF6175 family protein [Bacteroidales bacterium]MDY4850451.1 DUF6175 family protein [Paludibacteraceae bacterium]MDY6037028.1 DUF6175 family protein [Paludibacteraceae bacterium]
MKRLFLSLLAFATVSSLLAQAVQPSLMVFPSRAWCHQNGFEKVVVKANGKEVRVQEYDKAFIDNKDLGPAVRTIGKMMQDRGFQLVDLEAQLASQDLESALDNAGDEDIDVSAYDKLLETAGPDIALHINYYTETQGPRVTLFYDLTAFDAYTNKQVASTGLISYGPVMSAPLQTLIQSALLSSIDAFNAQLMQHFMDMQEKGREISVRINTFSGWEDGLETEVNGRELTEILEEWITNNCVAGRNHQKTASETSMYYDSARIPLFNENGKAVQAKQWLNGLRKYLKTLNVPSKVKTRGLGQAQLIIGE